MKHISNGNKGRKKKIKNEKKKKTTKKKKPLSKIAKERIKIKRKISEKWIKKNERNQKEGNKK